MMTIPAGVSSVVLLAPLRLIINDLRVLPHYCDLNDLLEALTGLRKLLLELRHRSWTVEEDSALQNLLVALKKTSSRAENWKTSRLRLLLEPSIFAGELSDPLKVLRESINKLQVSSKDIIVKQLDKGILNLSVRGDGSELYKAETEFKNQFSGFLRENRSKSDTTNDAISVVTWLAEHLGTDVNSIRQELQQIKENECTLLEELILYNIQLEDKICKSERHSSYSFSELGELAAESSCEGEESSDTNSEFHAYDKPLDKLQNGIKYLGHKSMPRVLTGFRRLIECTKVPGGKLLVSKAGAVPEAIRLAEETGYVEQALKLLEALTSSRGAGGENALDIDTIHLAVSDHLDVLITLMNKEGNSEARLLAAETVVNILVNEEIWQTVRTQYRIISTLVAISNEDDAADQSIHDLSRADRVCLRGLTSLAEFSERPNFEISSAWDKSQMIITALIKLLREGFEYDVKVKLAEDALVALETQVHRSPTPEVCSLIREQMSKLMVPRGFVSHSSLPGRMAIVSIMTKLYGLYKEDITEGLFLYLLKMIKDTGYEIRKLTGSREDAELVKDLTKLLNHSVKLLCFCVTHGKDKAQSVLTNNDEERKTLEEMLVDEQNSGILDESRLDMLSILDQIGKQSSETPFYRWVAILVRMVKSPTGACREQVASRLLKIVLEEQDVTEIQAAGGIDALMILLAEANEKGQQDALLALNAVSSRIAIQSNQLPPQTVIGFLSHKGLPEVRDAALVLLDLMVNENVVNAEMFMEKPGALNATLTWLDKAPESPVSQKSAAALLKMATEVGDTVRLGIANDGLGILVKYVRDYGTDEFKKLLTSTLGLMCKENCEEAVVRGGGHSFLLSSLQERVQERAQEKVQQKETAAQGLLCLLKNTNTEGDVLGSEFVTKALESVDKKFASAGIALGLAHICSTPEGLDQIFKSRRSVPALLILLEHCPEISGKGAAADVIAKLYPLLNCPEELDRQGALTDACHRLIKYIELDDKSQVKKFLEALAAFATGKKGWKMIHEERGQTPLINLLKSNDTGTQDLVLKILAEMSCIIAEGSERRDSTYFKILNAFLDNKIAELICPLAESLASNQNNTETMKNLLILIRNLSLSGPFACGQLSGQGAVNILLNVLKQHEGSFSIVTELAIKALEKFMDEPNGKQALLNAGGIRSLVAVLRLQSQRQNSDAKSFSTIILSSVAKDPVTRRYACERIFDSENILLALNKIMYEGETNRIQWQAAVLMKLLAMYGPTAKVIIAMENQGCLNALNYLRGVQHCKEMANDVLKFVKEHSSRECKRKIDQMLLPNSR